MSPEQLCCRSVELLGGRQVPPGGGRDAGDLLAVSRGRAAHDHVELEERDVCVDSVRLRDQRARRHPWCCSGLRRLSLRARHRRLGRNAKLGWRNLHARRGHALEQYVHLLPQQSAARSPVRDDARCHGDAAELRSLDQRHRRLLRMSPGHGRRQSLPVLLQARDHPDPSGRRLAGWCRVSGSDAHRLTQSIRQGHRVRPAPFRAEQPGDERDVDLGDALERDPPYVDRDRGAAEPRPGRDSRQHQVLALPHQHGHHRHLVRERHIPCCAHQLFVDAGIGAAVPQDCTFCHYTLMADAVRSDVTSGVNYAMKHAASQLSFQNCQVCHTAALSKSANTPIVSTLWQPALFHPSLASQPTACVVCHAVSTPAANAPTQSSVTYNMNLGSTSTNTVQWMNHGSNSVVGKDCVVCHAADAKTSGSAWSKSDSFHGHVSNAVSCKECHGLANGGGSVAGTNNNLPVGITNSNTVTSAAADSTTGIPAGTLDQITHTEINVSSHDCNFCHSQQGVSTVAGVQGKEWAQANFHMSFTSTNPLVMNGSTGRCSNCHMNVRPGASFAFDHSTFTAAAGSQDCGSCHPWPGTGTPATANWLGAAAAPDTVTLAGWASGTSITSNTVTFAHPRPSTYTSCAQCHAGTNFRTVIDYNHDGLTSKVTINGVAPAVMPNLGTSIYNASTNPTFCVACHNSKSPYVTRTGASSTITANTTSGSTTVTTGSTSTLTLGMTVTGTGIPSTTTTTSTITASTTSGSTTVTTASPVSLSAGTVISGPGIPPNDTVATSVNNATSFTLKIAATATASGVTLTATKTNSLTVTIKTIPSATSFTVSTAANATTTGTTLSVTHAGIRQASIGSHGGSTNGQDCTSCHAVVGRDRLTPPTPGVFGTGSISGN